MKLTLLNRSGHRVPRQFLDSWLKKLAKELKKEKVRGFTKNSELVIVFVKPTEIRKLNKTYRGKNYATDVLSFDGSEQSLGELVISPSVIKRQAKEHGLTVNEELGYMVLHGVLHLLGYDHEQSQAKAKRMFTIQDRVFERLSPKR
jgi:probable rRNA maturation factor